MGEVCTRNCRFCGVTSGTPEALDAGEPARLLEAVRSMGLDYVVITSVTRDDLPDGGAGHIAEIVSLLKRSISGIRVEVLVPDFSGDEESVMKVLSAAPDVFNHNIESVRSVFTKIRPQADYDRSLDLLRFASKKTSIPIKTGFMVGLGETAEEVEELIEDIYRAGVSVLTIGQYLRPSTEQTPVCEYITPETFEYYEAFARKTGIHSIFSGPFVRSSYRAAEVFSAV